MVRPTTPPRLVGSSTAIRALQEELEYAARSTAKVLITGESGVGKEVVARLIHERSARRHAPFIALNCAGIPDTLLESALFGHVRGSFTDAHRDSQGVFERAHRGTILLDEVGEMTLRMQALLLRFLETGEIQRVGDARSAASVDVRVIAATNRHLLDRIAAGEFREDLYYRLNVVYLTIPPLRERPEDIPVLLHHFLHEYAAAYGITPPTLEPDAMARLTTYDWPGNVRELRNIVERLTVRRQPVVSVSDLPQLAAIRPRSAAASPAPPSPPRAGVHAFARMLEHGESFWTVVYEPFMARDLTRDDVRYVVEKGLERTRGSYKAVLELFNMPAASYKRFLNFLAKHGCKVPPHAFRTAS